MKIYLWILAALFVFERLFLGRILDSLSGANPSVIFQSIPYIFEALLVAAFIGLHRKKLHFRWRLDWQWAFFASLNLICGAAIFLLGEKMGMMIPFDFESGLFALLLIVIAPILEEFLFRGILWEVSRSLFHSVFLTLFTTSILFSLDHFSAYFGVKAIFQTFVLY